MTIHLLSNPRNLSTALMYSFAQRPNMVVQDEPYYAAYLHATGTDHPGKDEILASMSTSYDEVTSQLNDLKKKPGDLFIKNMAHHLAIVDYSFSRDDLHIIYIRDPKLVINSFQKIIRQPSIDDIAIKFQYDLVTRFQDDHIPYIVLDSSDLLADPRGVLFDVCSCAGIPFLECMLEWEAGPKEYDGIWAKYWYDGVHQSRSFTSKPKKDIKLPDSLIPVYEEALGYYLKLKSL